MWCEGNQQSPAVGGGVVVGANVVVYGNRHWCGGVVRLKVTWWYCVVVARMVAPGMVMWALV